MALSLAHVRLSLIWIQSFFDLLGENGPAAPMGFLGRASTFASRFTALPPPGESDGVLSVPWPRPAGHYFWSYYLNGKRPGDTTGDQAWRQCVPFRSTVPARVSSDAVNGRIGLEAFYYPHGTALVATVTLEGSAELNDVVKQAVAIRRTMPFRIQWDAKTGPPAGTLTLNQAADAVQAVLRETAIGKKVAPAAQSVEPFSVLTVMAAQGDSLDKPVVEGSALHRACEALASWRPGWELEVLPPFSDATVGTRSGPAGVDVLYTRSRGRVVWFGRLLSTAEKDVHALSCYHRNLTFLSLQVDALGSCARATAEVLDGPGKPSAAHIECARRVAGLLGRLYGGKNDVYRSRSARKHIDQNALVDPINKVRDVLGMAPLT